ncbi:MAG TPA: Rieske 2Fe-2S domain-containing protein [Pseudonocardiaceae bacterium]|nr:Rieske 2Fe-2S domain-containing protein [Pseudonocardiaceae bacterium]
MIFSAAGALGRQWLPVASSADVQDTPAAVRLLGRDLVLWRGPSGAVVAAPDRCTHRKTVLSNGVVSEGRLVCPNHGWTFGDGGRCVFRPSGLVIAEHAHLKAHPCTERYGVIWVSLNEPGEPVIDLACDGDERYRRIHADVALWQASGIHVIEALLTAANSLFTDVTADVPFVVHGSLKSDDGAQQRRFVSCAPVDARASLVTTVVWTSSQACDQDAMIVDEATADLTEARSVAERETGSSTAAEITCDEPQTSSGDWKRRLVAFAC